PRALYSGVMYMAKVYDERMVKEKFLKFIDGIDEGELALLVKEFYKDRLSKIIYKDALNMMKNLKKQGYKVYLISASPEFYLRELYNIDRVVMMIGTRVLVEEGKSIRKMYGDKCKGEEKVRGLNDVLKKEYLNIDFNNA
ncbi:HAD-IB family phosphatase, partial [Acinetobacter baumannii]|nr:HAD-IB family phosphatase [Acinetobacter baumannii]